jgi:hypothetical protein
LTKIYIGVAFKPKPEWEAGNKGLNEGLSKLLMTLKNEKAGIKQQRLEHGMEAKFSKLPSKDLPKRTGLLTDGHGLWSSSPPRSTVPRAFSVASAATE